MPAFCFGSFLITQCSSCFHFTNSCVLSNLLNASHSSNNVETLSEHRMICISIFHGLILLGFTVLAGCSYVNREDLKFFFFFFCMNYFNQLAKRHDHESMNP